MIRLNAAPCSNMCEAMKPEELLIGCRFEQKIITLSKLKRQIYTSFLVPFHTIIRCHCLNTLLTTLHLTGVME